MALSAATKRLVSRASGLSVQIANSAVVYAGGFAQLRGPDHATSQGYAAPYNDEKGAIFAGLFESANGLTSATGDTSASPVPEAAIDVDPQVLRRIAVTGAASRGDIGKPVYATDDNTLSLTRPTNGTPVGMVVEWHTSTTCDVLLFGLAVQAAIDLGGQGQEILYLGELDFSTVADGDLRTGFPMPFHGEFLDFFGMVKEVCVGAGGTIAVNLEIDGTNVTGGVITYATGTGTDTLGEKLAGTAITAANVFHEGSLLDIEGASAGGTRTSGKLELYATVARKLGV